LSFYSLNYTLQDLIGYTLAFFLFPLVIVLPGYVFSSALDLFDFKRRLPIVKFGIGLLVSFAVSPIIFNLTSSLGSMTFSIIVIGGFVLAFLFFLAKENFSLQIAPTTKSLVWICIGWVVFVAYSLVDIHWGDQLYVSVVSFDQTSRVSVIDAMTRTGVPPINPSYFPGAPTLLTFLYYFWYILASLVDILGGTLVDARAALNASSAWSGLGLMAAIAFYLRVRNVNLGRAVWRSARIGVSLLAVSGLDVLPTIIIMLGVRRIYGTVEGWNLQMQIPTWNSSILWAPHHIAAMVACFTAILLALSVREKPLRRKMTLMTIAGMAFASSFGLSIWVTFLFGVFWAVWVLALFIQKTDRSLVVPMIFCGVVAVLLAGSFILGLLQPQGEGGATQSTVIFDVRTLYLLEGFVTAWPPLARSLLMLALLPLNYFLELGFFIVAGYFWVRSKNKTEIVSDPFYLVEVLLMSVVLLIGSTLRSTIANNDLGWRVWLPGQFILLIWGVDVIETLFSTKSASDSPKADSVKRKNLALTLLILGVLTSSVDALFLRVTWPLRVGVDEGRRGYSARLAYDFLRDQVPADVITQNNPLPLADRPSGLYGTHQMVISDRTIYGVSLTTYDQFVHDLAFLFTESFSNWQPIDTACQKYSIDLLIFNDLDPAWPSLATLKTQRPALYENEHYSIFACGSYTKIR